MNSIVKKVALATALLTSVSGTALASTSLSDVTLGGIAAGYVNYASGVNPQQHGGNASSFNSAFAAYGSGAWTALALFDKFADNNLPALTSTAFGNSLTMTFDKDSGRDGSWTIRNNDLTSDVTLDLVFAMHVGGGSGAWLFDNQVLGAGATLTGDWNSYMTNANGNSFTSYSNLTLFARDASRVGVADEAPASVPEPETIAMLLAGLGMIAFLSRRLARLDARCR